MKSTKLYTIEEARASEGGKVIDEGAASRRAAMYCPATPDEAAERFRCTVYHCTLSGQDCARRSIKARTGDEAPAGMLGCRTCPAGAARAKLLDPDFVPDPMDGRRPPAGRTPARNPRKRRSAPAAKAPAVADKAPAVAAEAPPVAAEAPAARPAKAAKASARAAKAPAVAAEAPAVAAEAPAARPAKAGKASRAGKAKRGPMGQQATCEACGEARGISRRPAKHPLRPYCSVCVGRAKRRIAHHIQGASPADIVGVIHGRPVEELRDEIAARGVHQPLRPRAVIGGCEKCGRARLYTRRPVDHPLYPYCASCCRDATGKVKHHAGPRVLTKSPAAVAIYIETGNMGDAVAQALADGAMVFGGGVELLEDSATGVEGGKPPGPLPPAATLLEAQIPIKTAPFVAPPLPSDLVPPGAAGGGGPADVFLRGAEAKKARQLLDELVADRDADRARIAGLEAQVRHLLAALAAANGLAVGEDQADG